MTYLEKTQQLQHLLDQGKDLEALDQFFHPDLVATEKPGGEQRHGLAEQKEAVEQWMKMLETYHGSGTVSITANEATATTMAETWVEATFKGAPGPSKMEEVIIYRWEGDKVKEMDFYYHNPMVGSAAAEAKSGGSL